MSNIAGKSYAMNVITPLTGLSYSWNKTKFKAVQLAIAKKSGETGFLGKLVPAFISNKIQTQPATGYHRLQVAIQNLEQLRIK